MIVHYVNLTNGIEAIPELKEFRFIRIQSTACEQKRWDFILQDLDYDFLMNLAIGNTCIVYDFSNKRDVSRAIFQGLEWVRYALNRRWLNRMIKPIVRGHNVSRYFDEVYRQLEDRTKKKLDYFKKFLLTDEIRLQAVCRRTSHDGNYEYYREILANYARSH